MNGPGVDALATAVLYEGYLLYPYRGSSVKNRHRWTFGTLYPRAFAEQQGEDDPWTTRVECLLEAGAGAEVEARVAYLHLCPTAVERDVRLPARTLARLAEVREVVPFAVDGTEGVPAIVGQATMTAECVGPDVYKLLVRVENLTPFVMPGDATPGARRDAAAAHALGSAQVRLTTRGGAFISLVDPPAAYAELAEGCRGGGLWPVLVGEAGARDRMLAAPIVLDDYPRIAPQSRGDYFDATEIDEMLALRVLTLAGDETDAVRDGDPRGRAILERTERLTESERRRLHGVTHTLRAGAKVRLRPGPGADLLDLALAGRIATILKLEEDYDGRVLLAVTVDDDPGRDLGRAGWPGHRFFFRPDEVEPLP